MPKLFYIKYKGEVDQKRDYLEPGVVVQEKIAYDLFELFGVKVPKTYLVTVPHANGRVDLGIASYFYSDKPKFISLKEAITEQNTSQEEATSNQEKYIYTKDFIESQCIRRSGKLLPLKNLFESLAAFALVMHYDALGPSLMNAGVIVVESSDSKADEEASEALFLKIDPGGCDLFNEAYRDNRFKEVTLHFNENLDPDLEKGLILNFFTQFEKGENQGVDRFREVFSFAKKEQKLKGLATITKATREQLTVLIVKKEYYPYIEKEMLERMVDTLWNRIECLKNVYQKDIELYFRDYSNEKEIPLTVPSQKTLIRPIEDFIKTTMGSKIGWGKPRQYIKLDKTQRTKKLTTSLLHHAADIGDLETVSDLFEHHADFNTRDNNGHPPIVYALKNKHVSIANKILEQARNESGKLKNSKPNPSENSLLHYVAETGDRSLFNNFVNFFYTFGINSQSTNKKGETPFNTAKKSGKKKILEWYNLGDSTYELLDTLEHYETLQFYLRCLLIRNIASLNRLKDQEAILEGLKNNTLDKLREISAGSVDPSLLDQLNPLLQLDSLINTIDAEISNRIHNDKKELENQVFNEEFKKIKMDDPLLIEASKIYHLSQTFDERMEHYFDNHWSAINKQRTSAIKNILNTFDKSLQSNCFDPYAVMIGVIIVERNNTLSHHRKYSCFGFFIKSALVFELNILLKQFNVDPKLEAQYIQAYYQYKTALPNSRNNTMG